MVFAHRCIRFVARRPPRQLVQRDLLSPTIPSPRERFLAQTKDGYPRRTAAQVRRPRGRGYEERHSGLGEHRVGCARSLFRDGNGNGSAIAEHTSLEGAVMALFADDGDEGLREECAQCTPLGERRAGVNRECSTPPQEMESERFVPEMLREDDADALQFFATSAATAAQDCVAIPAMLLHPHRQRLPHRPLRRRMRNTKNTMVEDGLKNVEHGATAYTVQGLEDASATSGSTALASLEGGKAIFAQIARSSPNRASVGKEWAVRGQAAHDLCYTCAHGDCFPPTHASPCRAYLQQTSTRV
ncbi:hypothetical protein C8R45DRAFT_117831 [Mycena sanguinolenta]|nr:hypothetical protein C8R45DRAFT_117831 [Mycena sanguinolenta]